MSIQSAGFNEKTFLDATGAPHTDMMTTTERVRKVGANQLEDVGRRACDYAGGAGALEPAGAAPGGDGENTRGGAGARPCGRFGDQHRGLCIGGEDEELRVRALGVQALERRLNELRNGRRVMRQDVQYVLIAGDSRSLPLFQVLLHQTPDFQWPATRRRGKVYLFALPHSSL